jgi:hypothetical protein
VIYQIATTQVNTGTALNANQKADVAEGLHTFEIEADGRTHRLSFKVEGVVTPPLK